MKFDFLSESDKAYFIHKASTLVEALPYIREHAGNTIVIKYGGHAMGDPKLSQSFAKDIGLIKEVGILPVIVHGGGPQIGALLKEKKIQSTFVEGLRVTDKETVKVVEEVLANDINKQIVESINQSGGKAIGLAGNKNNLIEASKLNVQIKDSDSNIEKILDIGFVGQPTKINTDILKKNLNDGYIPVIAPLGIDNNNNIYNINADTVAGALAVSLKSRRLLLMTDVEGVLDENEKLISEIKPAEAEKLIYNQTVHGGMIPKIRTCINAVNNNVRGVVIIDGRRPHSILFELFSDQGAGTLIRK